MKYLFYLLMIFSLLTSCARKENKNQSANKIEEQKELSDIEKIRQLYNSLPEVRLPFCYQIDSINFDGKVTFGSYYIPTYLFFEGFELQVIGKIKDTTNFFGFVYLYPGDVLVPVISTFDKNGKKIERNSIMGGGLFDGCYECPLSRTTIYKDLSIEQFYIEKTDFCDEEGIPIDSFKGITTEITGQYQLTKQGKLEFISAKFFPAKKIIIE